MIDCWSEEGRRCRRLGGAAALLASLALLGGCGESRTGAADGADRPDVVVVMIDTLRPDHLGFHGYERETAPYLAELAARSVVFRRAYSTSSWTAPACASLFTGLYTVQHGLNVGFFAQRNLTQQVERGGTATLSLDGLSPDLPSMPEMFREAGYRTWGVATNVNIGPELGFDRGFDRFARLHDLAKGGQRDAAALERRLLEWEQELASGGPDFVYLHFMDPHQPYRPRAPWYVPTGDRVGDIVAAYDSEIGYLDSVLARLLPRFGWDRDAVLVVLSDHGEEFYDHGKLGHLFSLHRELVQVLLMFRHPGVDPGETYANASIVDVLPTLLELAGLDAEGAGVGRSLVPLLGAGRGDAPLRDELAGRPLLAHRVHGTNPDLAMWSVTHQSFRLIERPGGTVLYDISSDFDEKHDLSGERPDLVDTLTSSLDVLRSLPAGTARPVEVEVDAEQLDRLRDLGYAD